MWGGREGAQVDKEHDKIQDEDTTADRGHELIGWPHDSSSTAGLCVGMRGEFGKRKKLIFFCCRLFRIFEVRSGSQTVS
jgi:hypothetical protein